jgi:DNA-binding CsgD family transcriptional regulator
VTIGVFGGDPQDGLADRIYEASVLPEFWPDVLRDFAQVAEGLEAVLVAASGGTFKWIGSSARAEKIAYDHYTYIGGEERSRRLIALRRAGFATDTDVFTDEEIRSLPLFADYLIPNGLGRGIATAIPVPNGDMIIVHSEGDHRDGPYGADVVQRLDNFRPHLARSALISARLAFERARTAVETLSGIGLAACAISKGGTVLVANGDFDAELSFWTTRGADRIALYDRRADRQLYDALGVIGTELGVRSLPLIASSGGVPAVLHIVPIRRAAHDLFSQAAAILVLTRASSSPTQATSLLQVLFDLSATEADVAARIAAGRTAEHIALTDGKSVDTVRNQIKSVLRKTGCARQVDLARLLAQLIPANA